MVCVGCLRTNMSQWQRLWQWRWYRLRRGFAGACLNEKSGSATHRRTDNRADSYKDAGDDSGAAGLSDGKGGCGGGGAGTLVLSPWSRSTH